MWMALLAICSPAGGGGIPFGRAVGAAAAVPAMSGHANTRDGWRRDNAWRFPRHIIGEKGVASKAPHTAASATIGKGVGERVGGLGGAMILDGTIPVGGGGI